MTNQPEIDKDKDIMELIDAVEVDLAISDRNHDAWINVRELIENMKKSIDFESNRCYN